MSIASSKQQLRNQLRKARRALSAQQQQQAAFNFVDTVRPILGHQVKPRLALYLAMDGELDLQPFIEYSWQQGIEVYLPILHKFNNGLWFGQYTRNSPLTLNRFQIPEPVSSPPIRPWQLNYVLFPLVGFDATGGRLGMGGGFYDRTFANAQLWPRKPKMFGVAHDCQKADTIPREAWDITLDGVLTSTRSYIVEK